MATVIMADDVATLAMKSSLSIGFGLASIVARMWAINKIFEYTKRKKMKQNDCPPAFWSSDC